MRRGKVTYLSYITVAENLESILEHGILSHNNAEEVDHISIANEEVQDRRASVILPSGESLHSYANLYFWARNGMMYRRRETPGLCVIRVSNQVLDVPGAYYSTRNASADGADFFECDGDFEQLDESRLYSKTWMSDNGPDHDKMQCMQAEVLIPDRIGVQFIECIYVRTKEEAETLKRRFPGLDVRVYPGLFFDQ